jgi:hypothetical protein
MTAQFMSPNARDSVCLHKQMAHSFNNCTLISTLRTSSKKAKKRPCSNRTTTNFPKNLRPISLVATTVELWSEDVLQIARRQAERSNLLKAGQSGFRGRHARLTLSNATRLWRQYFWVSNKRLMWWSNLAFLWVIKHFSSIRSNFLAACF